MAALLLLLSFVYMYFCYSNLQSAYVQDIANNSEVKKDLVYLKLQKDFKTKPLSRDLKAVEETQNEQCKGLKAQLIK